MKTAENQTKWENTELTNEEEATATDRCRGLNENSEQLAGCGDICRDVATSAGMWRHLPGWNDMPRDIRWWLCIGLQRR